jgi:hypothetical protein
VFDRAQCARITALAEALPVFRGKSSSADEHYRVCTTRFVEENAASAFVFERLRRLAHSLNRRYNFRLAGIHRAAALHRLRARRPLRMALRPVRRQTSTRKISISIQLSEEAGYAGGDFEFCPHG